MHNEQYEMKLLETPQSNSTKSNNCFKMAGTLTANLITLLIHNRSAIMEKNLSSQLLTKAKREFPQEICSGLSTKKNSFCKFFFYLTQQ